MRIAVTMLMLAAASLSPPAALAEANAERGQSLYETRCWVCHERSVHSRSPREAKTYQDIRGYVVRWDEALGGGWSKDEIDDVTFYLNQRYYAYPCPTAVCDAAAQLPRRGEVR